MPFKLIAAILLASASFSVTAQSDDSTFSVVAYAGSLHSGALFGKNGNGTSFSVFTIHGVRYKRFGFGAGLGYDAYDTWNVLPAFASLDYDLVRGRHGAFYLQLNSGYAKAWSSATNDDQMFYTDEGGFFYHPLVGYRVAGDRLTVYFSAGYKFQRLTYEQEPRWWIWGYPSSKFTVNRDMERLSLHIGIGW